MILTLIRFQSDDKKTFGRLYLDAEYECVTIEDSFHATKIHGKTRIPSGSYWVELRHSPKFTPKYGHQLLWLKDVPGFEYVLIHKGNDADDTEGCVIVGSTILENSIGGSKLAYDRLYPKVVKALNQGKNVHIVVIDYDR